MSKIVKASDPTIIHVFGGYYFDPIINQAYSSKVPRYDTNRFYALKHTKSGKFRFYDLVYSTEQIHGILKRNDLTKYSEIMRPKKTIEGAVKVRINNEAEFNQVVKAFQTLGYDWVSPGQDYYNDFVGIYLHYRKDKLTYDDDEQSFANFSGKLLTIPELMAIAYPHTSTTVQNKQLKQFKVRVSSWNDAERVILELHRQGYEPLNAKFQASEGYNVTGFIAHASGKYDWFSYTTNDSCFQKCEYPLISIKELCRKNTPEVETKWYDLKAGDKVKIDGFDHVYTVDTVESKTYERDLVVKFTEQMKTGERMCSHWATKSTKFVKVNSIDPQISEPVPTTKGWIIGNLNSDSKIEISDNPKIHETIEATETERSRLMNKHVGQTFVILEIKSYGKIETNPVTKIW